MQVRKTNSSVVLEFTLLWFSSMREMFVLWLFSLLCVCNKCVLIHVHAAVEVTPLCDVTQGSHTYACLATTRPPKVFALKRTKLPHNRFSVTGRSNSASVNAGSKKTVVFLEGNGNTFMLFFRSIFGLINHVKVLNSSPWVGIEKLL